MRLRSLGVLSFNCSALSLFKQQHGKSTQSWVLLTKANANDRMESGAASTWSPSRETPGLRLSPMFEERQRPDEDLGLGIPEEKKTPGEHANSTQRRPQTLHLLTPRQRRKPASHRAVTQTINETEKRGDADGDLWSTLQAISSPLPWLAAPTRAGGVPQGEALCGYHTPSSGCGGVKCQQRLPQPHWPAYLLSQQHGLDRLTDRQANRQTFAEGMTCRSWNIIGIQMKR